MTTINTPHAAARPGVPARPDPHRDEPERPRRLTSDQLLGGDREIEIEHGRATYRLRLTSLGKLILTK